MSISGCGFRYTTTNVPFFEAAERRLLETRALWVLHERPRTPTEIAELPGDVRICPEQRPYVEWLKVSSLSAMANSLGGHFATVYFLHGDTRRGIRKFIEENESELATVL